MTTSSSTKQRTDKGLADRGWPLAGLVVGLLLTPAFEPLVRADDWPVGRGDAASTGVAKSPLPDTPVLLWKYAVAGSAFEATPVVSGGIVYLGDADGTLHAVRLADGKPAWTRAFEETSFASAGAVRGDRLFLGDAFGDVRCVATSDGAEVWRFRTDSEVYAGPTFYKGTLLVTTEAGRLFALDTATGAERWRFQIEAPLRCSPTVVGGHTLLAGCDEKLHAIDLLTGREAGAVGIGGPTGSTAAVAGGRAYFGSESGLFFAVDATAATGMRVEWKYQDPRRAQGIRTAAAIGEKLLVYGSNGKALYALNRASGEPAWVKPVRSRVESSPVIAPGTNGAGRVVAATTRGRLLLLNLADGEEVWRYDAGGRFVGSPAVADGRLLIGNTDGTLYCFGPTSDNR
ncbi:MAG: PQQ-binding-like beta-propeller repeat protein [Planctomycetota bacterium]